MQRFPLSFIHLVPFKSSLKRTVVHRMDDVGGGAEGGLFSEVFSIGFFSLAKRSPWERVKCCRCVADIISACGTPVHPPSPLFQTVGRAAGCAWAGASCSLAGGWIELENGPKTVPCSLPTLAALVTPRLHSAQSGKPCKPWAVTAAGREERREAAGERQIQLRSGEGETAGWNIHFCQGSDTVLLQHTAQTGLQVMSAAWHPHWSSPTGNGTCTPPALLHGFTWLFWMQLWCYKKHHSKK